MKKHLLVLAMAFIGTASIDPVFAQDPNFTQFYANPLYLNPAFAGTARCPRICLNYRNEWPAITGTFVTYSASYDQHIDALHGGLGILVTNDKAGEGTINTTNISGMYSVQQAITRTFSIKAAFQATYAQKRLDWNRLTFGDQIDPKQGFVYNTQQQPGLGSRSNIDISAGVLGYSKKFFVGFAAHHLTQPDESLIQDPARLPIKFTGHAGALIPMDGKGGDAFISPNILYQQQQDFTQLNLGMYIMKGPIVGGLWYRNQDSFIALIGFQQDLFKVGYSYDVTVSKLSNATAGSHELSFQLQFECKPKKRVFRTISCPSF